jgi:hypothetical protein
MNADALSRIPGGNHVQSSAWKWNCRTCHVGGVPTVLGPNRTGPVLTGKYRYCTRPSFECNITFGHSQDQRANVPVYCTWNH